MGNTILDIQSTIYDWGNYTETTSIYELTALEDINVQAVTKSIFLTIPEFVKMSMTMVPMVTKYFWTEEQQKGSSNKFS